MLSISNSIMVQSPCPTPSIRADDRVAYSRINWRESESGRRWALVYWFNQRPRPAKYLATNARPRPRYQASRASLTARAGLRETVRNSATRRSNITRRPHVVHFSPMSMPIR